MNRTGVIIQARLNSKRFPRKVLADLRGKPVIRHVVDACLEADVGPVVVAVPWRRDNIAIKLVAGRAAQVASGGHPEEHVLPRVVSVARRFHIDNIIRVCGDCPSIQPWAIRQTARMLEEWDYVMWAAGRLPAQSGGMGAGYFPEGVRRSTLEKMLEHVTWGLWAHESPAFRGTAVPFGEPWNDLPPSTIDTPADLANWKPPEEILAEHALGEAHGSATNREATDRA